MLFSKSNASVLFDGNVDVWNFLKVTITIAFLVLLLHALLNFIRVSGWSLRPNKLFASIFVFSLYYCGRLRTRRVVEENEMLLMDVWKETICTAINRFRADSEKYRAKSDLNMLVLTEYTF